ncbi:MAG TPA: histidine kinase [Vicingaceae bacterium]
MSYSRTKIYWLLQLFGWAIYVSVVGYFNFLSNNDLSASFWLSLGSIFLITLLISHLFRCIIIIRNLMGLPVTQLIIPIFFGSLLQALVTYFLKLIVIEKLIEGRAFSISLNSLITGVLSWFFIYLLWSLLYFLFHYVTNYKKEEIKNLKWQAAKNEIELNRLISQLNPHFVFNSMNSIRALIDENPLLAKKAVTELSNVLRNSLLMGKKTLVPFSEELKMVEDYLSLEKMRFEEKLTIKLAINENAKNFLVPPLMIQTLVENAIKHGTSKLPKGGTVEISASLEADKLKVIIYNSGHYDEQASSETGFGLANTKQRLDLLYGKKAFFSIKNEEERVKTMVVIPNK